MKQRIARLRSDSERQWGKMNAPQAVTHGSGGLERGTIHGLKPSSHTSYLVVELASCETPQARVKRDAMTALTPVPIS